MLNDKWNTSNFIELEEGGSAAENRYEQDIHIEYVQIPDGDERKRTRKRWKRKTIMASSRDMPGGVKRIIDRIQLAVNRIANLISNIDNKITYLVLDLDDRINYRIWDDFIKVIDPTSNIDDKSGGFYFTTENKRIIDLYTKVVLKLTDFFISAASLLNITRRKKLKDTVYGNDRYKRLQALAQKEQRAKISVSISAIFFLMLIFSLGIIVLYGLYVLVKNLDITAVDVFRFIFVAFKFIISLVFEIFISMIFGFLFGEF